jgi:Flp pilus assembly secretin CpaC
VIKKLITCLAAIGCLSGTCNWSLAQNLSLEITPGQVIQLPLPKEFSKLQIGDPKVIDVIYVKDEPTIVTIRGIKPGFSTFLVSYSGKQKLLIDIKVVKNNRYKKERIELRSVNIPPPQIEVGGNNQKVNPKNGREDTEGAITQIYYCEKKVNGSCSFEGTQKN